MPTEDQMTINEHRKYLRLIRKRYTKAGKLERGRLLGEMEVVTGLHRKSLIRLMSSDLKRNPRRKQGVVNMALKSMMRCGSSLRVLITSVQSVCPTGILYVQPKLVWMATHLAHHGELEISHHLLDQLSQISVSTVRWILKRIRQDEPRLPSLGILLRKGAPPLRRGIPVASQALR